MLLFTKDFNWYLSVKPIEMGQEWPFIPSDTGLIRIRKAGGATGNGSSRVVDTGLEDSGQEPRRAVTLRREERTQSYTWVSAHARAHTQRHTHTHLQEEHSSVHSQQVDSSGPHQQGTMQESYPMGCVPFSYPVGSVTYRGLQDEWKGARRLMTHPGRRGACDSLQGEGPQCPHPGLELALLGRGGLLALSLGLP